MVTIIILVIYILNLFSIEHHLLHILVKLWASIANIMHMMVLKILDTRN